MRTFIPSAQGAVLLLLYGGLLAGCGSTPASVADSGAAPGSTERFPLAVVQYELRGDRSPDELCETIARHAREAAAQDAQLCVFPELIALDGMPPSAPPEEEQRLARAIAEEWTPRLVACAAALAEELDLALLVGGPRLHGEAVRNTEYLLMPDGRRIEQDKLFLTKWERDVGWEAGDELLVFDAPWGRSAIATCYDVEFPALSQALVSHAVEVLLVPSMTETVQGACRVRDAAETRAIEHCAFVVVACTAGRPAEDWQHFGQSAVLAPQEGPFHGLQAEASAEGASVLFLELDLGLLRAARAQVPHFPVRDQLERQRRVEVRRVGS